MVLMAGMIFFFLLLDVELVFLQFLLSWKAVTERFTFHTCFCFLKSLVMLPLFISNWNGSNLVCMDELLDGHLNQTIFVSKAFQLCMFEGFLWSRRTRSFAFGWIVSRLGISRLGVSRHRSLNCGTAAADCSAAAAE